jgi:hypothetical protein
MNQIAEAASLREGSGFALSGVAPLPGAIATVDLSSEAVNLQAMITPVGLHRTEDHDYYVDGQGPYPSVTSVLRVMHKPAIEADLKREVARHAVADLRSGELARMIATEGDEEAIKQLAAKGTLKRDAAATFGTLVHAMVADAPQSPQEASGALETPQEALPYLEAWYRFLGRSEGLEVISSEHAIFNLTEGYAGTYDFLARWHCKDHESCRWLFDVKSGKQSYGDWALQLEGYRHGEFVSLPNDPVRYPMPWADHVAVLHLRPDKYSDTGYRILEYVTGNRDWVAFLAALNLYQWREEKRFLVREGRLLKST